MSKKKKGFKLDVIEEHRLTKEEVLRRMQKFIKEMKGEYGEKAKDFLAKWKNSSCEFSFSYRIFLSSSHISGTITADAAQVKVHLDLPGIARLREKKIRQGIRERLEKVLAPAE